MSSGQIVRLIHESGGMRHRSWAIPHRVMKAFAAIGDRIKALPLDSERLHKLTSDCVVDNSPIKQALGVQRMPFDSVASLQSLFRQMRET